MQTIIIEVEGGVVQHVLSDCSDARVILINWDDLEEPGVQTCAHLMRSIGRIDELEQESREQFEHAIQAESVA